MKRYFNLSLISRYRTQLMGFAMICIMYRHSDFNDTVVPFILRFLRRSGYGGVDIFFLLSGIGIYFAYHRENIKSFFKKRFMRIIPYYSPIVILYTLLFLYPNGLVDIKGIIFRIFLLDYWVEKESLGWFIPTILLFYMLTPLLIKALGKGSFSNWLITTVSIIGIGLMIKQFNYWYIMNAVVFRLATYVLGLHIGSMIDKKKNIHIGWLIISFTIGLILYGLKYKYGYANNFINYYFDTIPFFFLALPICSMLSYLFFIIKNYEFTVLYFIGIYTLCIYIFHERIKLIMTYYNMPYIVLISAVLGIIIAYLWQNFISYLLKDK